MPSSGDGCLMNAKCTYQINGHYHFQMKVPKGFATEIGYGFIRKSLNTDSLPEALATSRFISSQLKTLFMQVKFGIIPRRNIKKVICQVLLNIESIKNCVSRLNTSVAIAGDVKLSMESGQEQETILLSSLIQMYRYMGCLALLQRQARHGRLRSDRRKQSLIL